MTLLNPNDRSLAQAACFAPSVVQDGLLEGWHCNSVNAMKQPQPPLDGWEQVLWNRDDDIFISKLVSCTSPEDVEAIVPSKWLAHPSDAKVDDNLARVCDLCTALVNRFYVLEDTGARTTAQWHELEALRDLVDQVVAVLESSIGDSISPAALREPAFLRQCWQLLCEDDQQNVTALIETSTSLGSIAASSRRW